MKWYECQGCGSEFRVVSDSGAEVEYCPFCSEVIEDEEDEEDDPYED